MTRAGNYALVECSAELRAKVTKVNADVQAMAPVLNSQTFTWSFGSGLDTMLKAKGDSAYLFAMTDGGTGSRSFKMPSKLAAAKVEVVGENRTLTVTNGTFADTFSREYEHHIYRITP